MKKKEIDHELMKEFVKHQRIEITEYEIYNRLASYVKHKKNKKILQHIAKDEMMHYKFWKKYTKRDVKPNKFKIFKYMLFAKTFGLVFSIKLMGKGENCAQMNYKKMNGSIPDLKKIIQDESKHEKDLINLLQEEKLNYVGSIVLGLNDAIVEITGVLAGLTFAFQNSEIVGIAGVITGIAASLSMAVSEYLSTKNEETEKHPLKASIYTGIAYVGAVLLLVFPFLILSNVFYSLAWTVLNAILIILVFTYYTSVAKDLNFKKRFFEMFFLSMGVALISFLIGFGLRSVVGVNI